MAVEITFSSVPALHPRLLLISFSAHRVVAKQELTVTHQNPTEKKLPDKIMLLKIGLVNYFPSDVVFLLGKFCLFQFPSKKGCYQK